MIKYLKGHLFVSALYIYIYIYIWVATRHFAPSDRLPHAFQDNSPHWHIGQFTSYAAPLNIYRLSSLSKCGFNMCHWINDCGKWCLILCGTNITTGQYYKASTEETMVSWMCRSNNQMLSDALLLVAESTRLSSNFCSVYLPSNVFPIPSCWAHHSSVHKHHCHGCTNHTNAYSTSWTT